MGNEQSNTEREHCSACGAELLFSARPHGKCGPCRRIADQVNHPPHYTFGRFEVIDVIEDWRLGFALGNCVKYIARADHKNRRLEDLRKARFYLEREIKNEETRVAERARLTEPLRLDPDKFLGRDREDAIRDLAESSTERRR